MAFDSQLQNMIVGVLDLKALVFFFSVILFSLLLTHRTVEAQRWA
jgi:ABC-2 type transport system permease protein